MADNGWRTKPLTHGRSRSKFLSIADAENAHQIYGDSMQRVRRRGTRNHPYLWAACVTAQRGGRHQGSVGSTGAIIGLVERDALVLFGPVARCWSFLPCFAHSTIALGSARRATTVPG